MRTAPTLCLAFGILLGGCDRGGDAASEVRQTKFPGQVTSGGLTSGEVMAQATPKHPAPPAANAPQEGVRGQAPAGSVSGTPSIPEGAGGTASGAQMGGTTPGAAATQAPPAPSGGTPGVPRQEGK
ncbi:hypothetical protein [Noviherbaspirillum aridicola]|uniref:Lipoprotein n=1 Tax=Noviherbaspirillum aridicola TaxID=2849687 RepID=A0ABQ4Q0D8_9BURK|nr:hypothetical protein [Noviherbaspirillum aridicola]GIZ50245.1 hypothetical protein NCCP691_02590 [Noviherbaspirillum aridicola]